MINQSKSQNNNNNSNNSNENNLALKQVFTNVMNADAETVKQKVQSLVSKIKTNPKAIPGSFMC